MWYTKGNIIKFTRLKFRKAKLALAQLNNFGKAEIKIL